MDRGNSTSKGLGLGECLGFFGKIEVVKLVKVGDKWGWEEG